MRRLSTLAVFLLFSSAATAADWPQWLGPNRDGSTPEVIKPWTAPPKVVWRQPVGDGYSAPVVAGGKVFVLARVGEEDREELLAFDAAAGKPLWRTAYARNAVTTDCGGYGPRATPAVAGGRVYTHGISGVISCFDAATGKLLWQVDAHERFGAPRLKFGASSSPLVEGRRVIVQVGAKGAAVVAIDAETGTVAWQVRDDTAGYASPTTIGDGSDTQVVLLTGVGLVAVRPGDGVTLWEYPIRDVLGMRSVTPVRAGDVLFTSSMLGGHGLRLGSKDGKPAASPAWRAGELTCYTATPLAVGNLLYVVTNSLIGERTATLRCVDAATGKELWHKPGIGKYHAGLIRTGDGRVLMLDEAGELFLLEADAKAYRELARAKVCGPTMALPAPAGGKLYVRDGKEVLCLHFGE